MRARFPRDETNIREIQKSPLGPRRRRPILEIESRFEGAITAHVFDSKRHEAIELQTGNRPGCENARGVILGMAHPLDKRHGTRLCAELSHILLRVKGPAEA